MANDLEGGTGAGAGMEEGGFADPALIADRLRVLIRRAREEEGEARMHRDDVAALEAAARSLDRIPAVLRDAMQTAFRLGREHGKKEEILTRLEREIALETARLGRQAWGTALGEGAPGPDP
jgi:hypothetical protein